MKKFFLIWILTTYTFTGIGVVWAQQKALSPRVSAAYYKSGDELPYLKIKVRKRENRKYFSMPGIQVEVYFGEKQAENMMGQITTNQDGEARVSLPRTKLDQWLAQDTFEFLVFLPETDSTREVMETLPVSKARLVIDTLENQKIQVTLTKKEEEGWLPVEAVEVKLFVKRYFGKLPLTDQYLETDDSGVVTFDFDQEIPGGEEGQLVIGGMIEDHDEFGNVLAYAPVPWGIPLTKEKTDFKFRSLWSVRNLPPYWLLIFANLILISIWGIIIYLLIQIFQMKKFQN